LRKLGALIETVDCGNHAGFEQLARLDDDGTEELVVTTKREPKQSLHGCSSSSSTHGMMPPRAGEESESVDVE
jgi:hypothetical protein